MTATRQSRPSTLSVNQISLPQDARVLSTLPRIDYHDAFVVTAEVDHTAEQWVRAVLQDAPPAVRRRLWLGWTALGLKLALPWSRGRVLGWEVMHRDPAFVLLAADSWLGLRGQLLFRREPHGLLFATFVEHTNPVSRALWVAITPRHQRVVRSLLMHAGLADGLVGEPSETVSERRGIDEPHGLLVAGLAEEALAGAEDDGEHDEP
jgi:hypothetical protein